MPSSTCSRCDYCVSELDDEGEEVSRLVISPDMVERGHLGIIGNGS